MLTLGTTTRVFVALGPVDMRGSFDELAGHVLDSHLYLYVSRRRRPLKALWFDRIGWAIFAKRLERGSYELPAAPPGVGQIAVDRAQLAMILEGIDLTARRRLRYHRRERSGDTAFNDLLSKRIDKPARS